MQTCSYCHQPSLFSMSLLNRTKSYFFFVCALMCGFLLMLSWHLLYGTYSLSVLRGTTAGPLIRRSSEMVQQKLRQQSSEDDNKSEPLFYDSTGLVPLVRMDDGENESEILNKGAVDHIVKSENIGKLVTKKHQFQVAFSTIKPLLKLVVNQSISQVPHPTQNKIYATKVQEGTNQKAENAKLTNQDSVRGIVQMDTKDRSLKHTEASVNSPKNQPSLQGNKDIIKFNNFSPKQGLAPNPNFTERKLRMDDNRKLSTDYKKLGTYTDLVMETESPSKTTSKLKHEGSEKPMDTKTKTLSPGAKNSLEHVAPNLSELTLTRPISKLTRTFQGNMAKTVPKSESKVNARNENLNILSETTVSTPAQKNKSLSETGARESLFMNGKNVPSYHKADLQQLKEIYRKNPWLVLPDLSNLDGEGTRRPDYCTACFNYDFPILINQEKLCLTQNTKRIQLMIFISSAPSNYQIRTVIRDTWGAKCREKGSSIRCLFVVGLSGFHEENEKVKLESEHHEDIVQIGFTDSYSNLTYKTMSSLLWATKYCYSAKFVMKTDDDMYINTELIPIMLEAVPKTKFMGGFCWGSSSPNRDITSKWYVSFQMFHKAKFPPMCSGTGYIMSSDIVSSVLFASRNVPFFYLEDVYIALCLQKLGILPVNIMGFSNMFQEFDACRYRNAVMTSHQVPPELIDEFWSTIKKCPSAHISPAQLYIVLPYPETD